MNAFKAIEKLAGRPGLILRKHSPEILLVVGVVGVVGATVLACRATLKVEEVLYDHEDNVNHINEGWEKVQSGEIDTEKYTEKDYKKDLTVAYTQTGMEFVKLYAPSVALGVASVACIIGGHNILNKRNMAIMAAYKAVSEGFEAYRKRIIEEFGADKDYMFKHNLRAEVIDDVEVDENGKTKKVKKTVMAPIDPNGVSKYARFFDETSTEFSDSAEYNMMYLRSQQNLWNDMLQARGHVFLNEVYESLGIDHDGTGAVTGWVLSKDGDNFIDFGIFDGDREGSRRFVNGQERAILLDFNVDGLIWDKI